jgi:hypothetical protein
MKGGRNITLLNVKFQNTTWCFNCIALVGQNTWQLNMRQVVKLDNLEFCWQIATAILSINSNPSRAAARPSDGEMRIRNTVAMIM